MQFQMYDSPQRGYNFSKELIALRGHKCEQCGNTEWLDMPIKLEVHHKNGNKCDCTLANLQLLCPNCHAYTDNYGIKNLKRSFVSDEVILSMIPKTRNARQLLLSLGMSDAGANYERIRKILSKYHEVKFLHQDSNTCPICGENISLTAKYCSSCYAQNRRIVERPTRDELKSLIRTKSFVSIAALYGVSDNAIRKWCESYSLPKRKTDIKQYTDEQWEKI